jgi:hypothetical protein
MKTYAFVFAKTHGANRRRKSSPLANRDSPHSSYNSSALPEILPSAPQIFPYPLALIFPFFFSFFFFSTSLNKTIKESKTSKKKKNA